MISIKNNNIKSLNTKLVDEIKKHLTLSTRILSDEDIVIKSKCESSLYEFVKYAWPYVEGENLYIDNWHVEALCDHLEACFNGEIKFLIINIPPRCMKSLICNIFFPAWIWLKRPSAKTFCLSGSHKLAVRDSVKCRQLMLSSWYQNLWGNVFKFSKDVNTKERYANNKGGEKLVKSILGSSIGEGGHFLVIDDGNSQQDITSKTTRDRTAEIVDSSFCIRQDNTDKAVLICIQQRLHWEDLTGHFLAKKLPGTVHLMLPMEFEPHRRCITIPLKGSKKPWCDPRTKEGELLWPKRFNPEHVARLKIFFGTSYNIASQLQQLPAPESGNIFKREWFNVWNEKRLPPMDYVIQSWDTALSTKVNACESALTTWGIFTNENNKKNVMLINVWTGRLEQPELRKMIKKCQRNYFTTSFEQQDTGGPSADIVLIEEASGGLALIQDLRLANLPVMGFNPRHHGLQNFSHMTNKADRARLASLTVEQKLLWLTKNHRNPNQLSYASSKLLEAALSCPTGGNQDLIDSMSQAFIFIRKRNLLHFVGEEPPEQKMTWDAFYEMEEKLRGPWPNI
jgi:phage terminase large subunit-like protein